MPRMDFKGKKITNNLAYYDLYKCDGVTGSCSLDTNLAIGDLISTNNPPDSKVNYIQGLSYYVAFGFVLFLSFFIYYLVMCCCRYLCCCCTVGGCGCCCRSIPTPKNNADNKPTGDTSCCCGCFGYVRDTTSPQGFAYPAWEKWFARIYAWIFCACTVAFSLAIILAGSEGLTKGMYSMAESPKATASLVSSLSNPMNDFLATSLAKLVSETTLNTTDVIVATTNPSLFSANVQGLSTYGPKVVFPSTFRSKKVLFQATQQPVTLTLAALTLPEDPATSFPGGSLTIWNTHATPITTVTRESDTGLRKVQPLVSAVGTLQGAGQLGTHVQSLSTGISAWPLVSGGVFSDYNSAPFYTGVDKLWNATNTDFSTAATLASTAATYKKSTVTDAANALTAIIDAKTAIDALNLPQLLTALSQLHKDQLVNPDLVTTVNTHVADPTFSPIVVSAHLAAADSTGSVFIANSIVDSELNNTISSADLTVDYATALFGAVKNVTTILELSEVTPFIDNTEAILANITGSVDSLKDNIEKILDAYARLENTDFNAEINNLLQYYSAAIVLDPKLVGKDGDVTNISDLQTAMVALVDGNSGTNTPTPALMTSLLTALDGINKTQLETQRNALNTLLGALTAATDTAIDQLQSDATEYASNSNQRVCRGTADPCTADPACVCLFTKGPDEEALLAALENANIFTPVAALKTTTDSTAMGVLADAPAKVDNFHTAATTTNDKAVIASPSAATLLTILDDAKTQEHIILPSAFDGPGLHQALLITLASAQVSANDLETTLQSLVDETQKYLGDYQPLLLDVDSLLTATTTCLPVFASNIDTRKLNNLYQTQGLAAVWDALVNAMDGTAKCFDTTTSLVSVNPDIANKAVVKDARKFMERLHPSRLRHGGLHYFMSWLDESSTVDGDDPSQYRYESDVNGMAYPNGKKCYTVKCLRQEIRRVNYEPISEVSSYPVPLSREAITLLPLVFPALCVILLLLASLLGLCVASRCDNCITHLANGSLCVMFLYGTLTFLIVSTFFFPVLLATGDTCQSMANLALKHVMHVSVCSDISGTGDINSCVKTAEDFTFTLQPIELTSALLGNNCGAGNAVETFWASARTELMKIPDLYIKDKLNDPTDAFFGVMRGSLRTVMDTSVDKMYNVVGDTVASFGRTLDCEGLASTIGEFTSSTCCGTANALYWIICGYYLLGWAVLLCGVPSALMGRKRFRNSLWGGLVEKHQEMYGSEHKSQNGLEEALASEEGLPLTDQGILTENAMRSTEKDAEPPAYQPYQGPAIQQYTPLMPSTYKPPAPSTPAEEPHLKGFGSAPIVPGDGVELSEMPSGSHRIASGDSFSNTRSVNDVTVGLNSVQSGSDMVSVIPEHYTESGRRTPSLAEAATAHLVGYGHHDDEDGNMDKHPQPPTYADDEVASAPAGGALPPPEISVNGDSQTRNSRSVESPKFSAMRSNSYSQQEAAEHVNAHLTENDVANLDEDAVAVGIDADEADGEAAVVPSPPLSATHSRPNSAPLPPLDEAHLTEDEVAMADVEED